MRKVSSFFPAVSKDLHVSLSKVLAAAKEVSENVKRAKILENYESSNQLRKQRRLEDSQNAREFDLPTKFGTRIRITAMLKRVKILQQFNRDIFQQLHYQ